MGCWKYLLILVCVVGAMAQGGRSDVEIVQAILDSNELGDWKVEERVTVNDGGRVTHLDLSNKNFGKPGIHSLTSEIGYLIGLEKLTLDDNDLESIPAEIANLKQLKVLEIRSNSIEVLPPQIGELKNLREIDLRNNEFSRLPPEIGRLKSVWKLQLWGNNLTSLPPEIGDMMALREIYLRGNRLATLPQSILRLNIKYIDLQDNVLCELEGGPLDTWLKSFDDRYKSSQKCWLVKK